MPSEILEIYIVPNCLISLKYINGLNRSKNIKKGYSKFSIAFCGLLQRMMDFCKVRRILISCIDVIVRCQGATNNNVNASLPGGNEQ